MGKMPMPLDPTAAHTQAYLIALTHNLLTILISDLEVVGITEAKIHTRTAAERTHTPAAQRLPSREKVRHAMQLTCQFIRLVRHCLEHRTRWSDALPLFEQRLSCYL